MNRGEYKKSTTDFTNWNTGFESLKSKQRREAKHQRNRIERNKMTKIQRKLEEN